AAGGADEAPRGRARVERGKAAGPAAPRRSLEEVARKLPEQRDEHHRSAERERAAQEHRQLVARQGRPREATDLPKAREVHQREDGETGQREARGGPDQAAGEGVASRAEAEAD